MAGRNRLPRHALNGGSRGFPPGPGPIRDGPFRPGPLPHPARMEEELDLQYEEIQRLLAENRRLAATHVDLRRELAAAQDELHRLNQIVGNVKVDKERQARDLVDKCMNLESELRAVEPLRNEVMQLRADTQKLNASRQELSAQVQALNQDLTRAQADLQQVPALRAELDSLRQELIRSRTAIEYEKKANTEQFEQRQAMEKNLISMAREVEKLRAEQILKSEPGLLLELQVDPTVQSLALQVLGTLAPMQMHMAYIWPQVVQKKDLSMGLDPIPGDHMRNNDPTVVADKQKVLITSYSNVVSLATFKILIGYLVLRASSVKRIDALCRDHGVLNSSKLFHI